MLRSHWRLGLIAFTLAAAGAAAADEPVVAVSTPTHRVTKKETLWSLAKKYYGNPDLWRRIAVANAQIVNDPDLIFPGQVLEIPKSEPSVVPPLEKAPVPQQPEQAPPSGTAPAVILDKLEGLVLVNDPQLVTTAGLAGVKGVEFKGLPYLEQSGLREKLAGYVGQTLTRESKARLMADIVLFMRRRGRPLVDVSTPPQEITGGILQVLVMEGTLGQVRVEGGRWFDPNRAARQLRALQGMPIDAARLSEDLDWINRNPFRSVDLVYTKSAEPGKTDLVLRQTDRFPLRVYTGYEDSGTNLTGDHRWLAGFNWGNVFGSEGTFNYQFLVNPADFRKFRVHTASFLQPLPWRHTLTAYYSRVDTKVNIPPLFRLGGFSWQTGMRYEAPLPRVGAYKHAAVLGFDFKRANNALAFGGIQVFDTTTDVVEWSLGYNSSLIDRLGKTTFRATGFFSPGAMTGKNTTSSFRQTRAGARAHYVYSRFEVNRTNRLPWNFLLVNALVYQRSDSNLLGSEQIGFGGHDTIRGYDTRVLNTDHGTIFSNELRTPPISPLSLLGLAGSSRISDKLQFLGFADYGVGSNKELLPGEKSSTVLFGAGMGLRYMIAPYLSVRADHGWQLRQAEPNRRHSSRWHIGAVASF